MCRLRAPLGAARQGRVVRALNPKHQPMRAVVVDPAGIDLQPFAAARLPFGSQHQLGFGAIELGIVPHEFGL